MSKSTIEIRQEFLDFFSSKNHQVVAGSSLIPNNDPTLLFTNSGMNQFKDIFLGTGKRDYLRATTSQFCIRAGGKHNDLENVGYTTRHHTFFEMLGNFSFGDYFKYDAIRYAWELLTSKNWFNLTKERLLVTVYETDDETYEIWKKEIGIPHERIIRIGDSNGVQYTSDNFWKMGETGPCGPCTEIFYDYGEHICSKFPSGTEEISERYIEIWNIVFMQFNIQADGTMQLLPKPSVDTGMGLERIASVLQHVNSNYDIDLFRKLIESIAYIIGTVNLNNKSLYVIADHIRSCSFLIASGVNPSNENRGYVLRRIIRRAIRHGNTLGVKEVFFYKLVEPLIEVMGTVGESLRLYQERIKQILKIEEEQFICTLRRGLALLDKKLAKLSNDTLDGRTAFYLYDTYGFPIDLTIDVCRAHNIKVDKNSFSIAMEEQRQKSLKFKNLRSSYNLMLYTCSISKFYGYDHLKLNSSIVAIFLESKMVDSINTDQEAIVILDKTPFYAESGGQVGDHGELKNDNFNFIVYDTQKYGQFILHIGKLIFGTMKVYNNVRAEVNEIRRTHICLNHSATHLMHAALRKVLGAHVVQKGSLINDKILRFDFLHLEAMKPSEIYAVEDLVNTQIRRNLQIETQILDLETAKTKNPIMLFNEKYDKYVRMLSIGNFSIELCGGTHTSYTGNIGLFHILSEFSIAAGVRRIEAVTGENAINNLHIQSNQLNSITRLLNSNGQNLFNKVHKTLERVHTLEKELQQLKEQLAIQKNINLYDKVVEIKGIKVLSSKVTDVEPKILRSMVNILKNRLSSAVIVLATVINDRILLIAGISKNINNFMKAKELISILAQQIDGKGGGCSDIAQVSGMNVKNLSLALDSVKYWVSKKL